MCIYGGHTCTCIPNMKFLCLTLRRGKVCTDDNTDSNDNEDDTRRIKTWLFLALWLMNQMSQKPRMHFYVLHVIDSDNTSKSDFCPHWHWCHVLPVITIQSDRITVSCFVRKEGGPSKDRTNRAACYMQEIYIRCKFDLHGCLWYYSHQATSDIAGETR